MGQYSSTLVLKAFCIATLFEIGIAAPVDGSVTVANPSEERDMVIASLIGVLSVMLVMVMSILLCAMRVMDHESYAARITTIHSRATTSTAYRDATDKDQDTNSLSEQENNGVHVADLSRNSNLPFSKDSLPRHPTTLDFNARDPLIASPNGTDVVMHSESETRVSDAGMLTRQTSATLTSSFHIPPFLAAQTLVVDMQPRSYHSPSTLPLM